MLAKYIVKYNIEGASIVDVPSIINDWDVDNKLEYDKVDKHFKYYCNGNVIISDDDANRIISSLNLLKVKTSKLINSYFTEEYVNIQIKKIEDLISQKDDELNSLRYLLYCFETSK